MQIFKCSKKLKKYMFFVTFLHRKFYEQDMQVPNESSDPSFERCFLEIALTMFILAAENGSRSTERQRG